MSPEKLIYQGAEAVISKEGEFIIKDRISKGYRIPELDRKIIKQRTKQEARILEKASKLINVPFPEPLNDKNQTFIKMPFIKGKKMSEELDNLDKKTAEKTCTKIGESIAKLHDADIIHGDLTTSNMILDSKNNIWFIDFGLGFHSKRIEDKAVDLHLIKQALEAKHFKNWNKYFEAIVVGYKNSKDCYKTLEQLKKVESRGRYKDKH
ncbi:Kae1-associated serine/threonine protein kinase [Candidatus Pacearchaeota archaeon]|nr:Kae1-associated serine/threonine protein kinase [Candidatus Pacearchaeota archaeon]